jgi:branched-chain amino acid transport system substrate-binding protein
MGVHLRFCRKKKMLRNKERRFWRIMFARRNAFGVVIFSLCLFFSFGSLTMAWGEQDEKMSIAGFEGMLKQMEVSTAISEIKKLEIGQPLFLKDREAIEAYGIDSCSAGVLERGNDKVSVFKLKFQSEEKTISSINLERKKLPRRTGALTVEDVTNLRNPDFGLFFDGTYWSGYRRNRGVLALMKGAVSQEDFFHIMEKVLPVGDVSAADPPGSIKIGLIGTFSGPLVMQGIDMRDGTLLALEEASRIKEMKGQSFELVVADDRGNADEAIKQAKRLIEKDKVSVILGPVNSTCALAVAPLVSKAKIPMITLATQPKLTQPLNRYVFRGNISDDDLGKVMADYTKIILAGDRIALLYEDTPYGKAGMEAVRQRFRRVGVEPVATEAYVSGDIDFGAQMARLKEAKARFIIVYGTMADAQNVMQSIRTSGLDARVIASSGWASIHLLPTVPRGLDGVVVAGYTHMVPDSLAYLGPARIVLSPIAGGHYQVVTGDLDTNMFPAWTPFYKSFKDKYGRRPDLIAGYAYSNLLCLLEAMQRVQFDAKRIVEGLEETENFPTVFGHFINYHDENHNGMRYINFSTYRNGRVELATKDKSLDATKMREKGLSLEVAGYRGELSPLPPNTAAFFVLHMGFGYPPFMKEKREMGLYGGFRSDYEFYGMKYTYSGTLYKGKDQIMLVKMSFRSPDRAMDILDLEASKEALGDKTKLEKRPEEMRDSEVGVSYADGLWSAYKRKGGTVVFAKGEVPLEDLKAAMEAAL